MIMELEEFLEMVSCSRDDQLEEASSGRFDDIDPAPAGRFELLLHFLSALTINLSSTVFSVMKRYTLTGFV